MINGRAIIGLDLDGVVADYTAGFRPYVAERKGVKVDELPEPEVYSLVKADWGFTDVQDYLDAHRAAVKDGLYARIPLIEGASEAITKFSEAGAHIRIVTHRLILGGAHKQVVSDTAQWLDEHEIPYMSLCFTGLKDSVAAHVYIEDSPRNIEELRSQGFPTVVFDQAYNRHVAGPRIMSWLEDSDIVLDELIQQGQIETNTR